MMPSLEHSHKFIGELSNSTFACCLRYVLHDCFSAYLHKIFVLGERLPHFAELDNAANVCSMTHTLTTCPLADDIFAEFSLRKEL